MVQWTQRRSAAERVRQLEEKLQALEAKLAEQAPATAATTP
jgi:hypothetical protein